MTFLEYELLLTVTDLCAGGRESEATAQEVHATRTTQGHQKGAWHGKG